MRLKPLNSFKKENPVAFLTKSFFKEYDEVMLKYGPSEQLEVTEHFLKMMDQLSAFADSHDTGLKPDHSEEYLAATDALLIKYGSKFKPYMDQYFIQYFLFPLILVTKGYYSAEEVQEDNIEPLSALEGKAFSFICKGILIQKRVDLLTIDAHILTKDNGTENDLDQINQQESNLQNATTNPKLLLMVEDKLSPFKDSFNNLTDYAQAIQAIAHFLDSSKTYSGEVLFVKGGVVKKLAYALGDIWRSQSNEIISIEYLMLYTRLFSIFSKIEIDQNNLFSNNLYKYSISKT
jgi:hypothetical protein